MQPNAPTLSLYLPLIFFSEKQRKIIADYRSILFKDFYKIIYHFSFRSLRVNGLALGMNGRSEVRG